jgi:uncharacterized membrane protein
MLPQPHGAHSHRFPPAALVICYGFVVLACLTIRPLWLDEVRQLIGTTIPSLASMLRWVPYINVGGVPLGYLTQRPFVLAGGASAFWARLPSALFSVASCWLLVMLCRELKIPRSTATLAAGIFMIVPAQFRYATEARPYSESLCFTLLSMLAIARWANLPSLGMLSLCLLAMVAGLYTQPYMALAVCGLCVWNILSGFRAGDRLRAATPAACLCVSILLFLPWYLWSTPQWDANIQRSGYPKFHWTIGLGQDVFKGISGGSFLCSAALLILVLTGVWSSTVAIRGLLVSSASFVIVGALAVDSVRNYFFASRQFLFALPALSILAAFGFETSWRRNKLVGAAIACTFLIAALINNVTMQVNAKEDWPAAAHALAQVSLDGYCIQMAESHGAGLDLYRVFVPRLASGTCGNLHSQTRVALVSNIATEAGTLHTSEDKLRRLGFALRKTVAVGGTAIEMEDR